LVFFFFLALAAGAVNTLVWLEGGRIRGGNTGGRRWAAAFIIME